METNTTSQQNNLQNITLGFDGTMAVVGQTAKTYGGSTGEIFAASFSVMNGVITGVLTFEGSSQTREELEKIAVGAGAGMAFGLTSEALLTIGLGALIGTTAAASSPVLLVGAGATAIIAGLYGDDIYNEYVAAQKALFQKLLELGNDPEVQKSLSSEEKQRLQDMGYTPSSSDLTFSPTKPSDVTYDPTKLNPAGPGLDHDLDHDGIPDLLDPDMDGDGLPDYQDSDMDNDGIPNDIDPDPLTPEPNPDDGHPFDPENFDPPRRDPLVLDMNKDGLISTVSLADSTAFFDLTGDGIKEKVGWVQATEGIVAFDKNGNGKIDGIGEVFGTATTSGFAELRTLADSNYDGVIDRRDELYNQLKVWQDANQDGISQANELKTLAEAGVNNIELNVFATNINLNGNLLTEAGRYSDSTGTRSLAADIELTFDARITTVDTSLIPDYTIHPESASLPKFRGYGAVYNSEIAYNVNDTLRNLAIGMAQDITAVAKNFDTFLEEWSGLNTLLRTAQEKYALTSAPVLSEMDKKVWVYEHFMGNNRFSSGIEEHKAMANNRNFNNTRKAA